jgi:predicted permease
MLRDIASDLRHASRTLRKNPGFTLTALATLALAIGANLGVFTLANALILASIPVPSPDRLMEVSTMDSKGVKGNLSIPTLQLIQKRTDVFASVLAWNGGGIENIEMNGTSFPGAVDEVAGDYYATLAIRPALGRFITREDIGLEHFTPSNVAVIGYRTWQERYHGDPAVVGKTAVIHAKPYTIIGVHPKSFPGLIREVEADATIPITAYALSAERVYDRKAAYNTVIGRLRDGIDPAQARAGIEAAWPAIRQATAPDGGADRDSFLARRVQVEPAGRGISYLRERFTRPLYILFGIVGLLLLLACVNLANVTLARAHKRAAEFSLRSALGASRWRLLRASLIESLLLAICGAIPGLAFAYWGSNLVARFMWQGYVPLALSLKPDTRVVLFTIAVAVTAAALFGLFPAWRAGRQDTGALIQHSGSRVAGGLGLAGRALVVVQIALSFAILAGALLFTRSLGNILRRNPGFSADRLLVAQLFPRITYQGFDKAAYFRQLLESLQSIPGATAATFAHNRPIGLLWKQTILPQNVSASYHLVAPGFFDTLKMRILRGRDFDLHDDASRPTVAIVSANLARLLGGNGDAIGLRVKIGDVKEEFQVVGIASDATLDDPRTPNAPAIYVPIFQRPDNLGWAEAIVRTSGDPARLARALREHVETLGREYPLRIETVGEEYGRALLPERILALLSGFFGALGLLLAAVGLYGLLAYTVSRRTAEIGVRAALGATRRDIAGLVLREVAIMLGMGLAAGVALAFAGGRAVSALLYGLSGHDPGSLLLAAGGLVLIAAAASLIPALRAARVDPVIALRYE